MKTCPVCGAQMPDSQNLSPACGADYVEAVVNDITAGVEADPSLMLASLEEGLAGLDTVPMPAPGETVRKMMPLLCGVALAFCLLSGVLTGANFFYLLAIVALILLAGIAQYIYAQVALVDLPFSSLLKNSLMLFLGYLPRSALGILWQGLYWAAIALFWPLSGAVLILTSLWFPCSLSLLAIYPALNKSFVLEAKIKAMRDAQLDSHDED